jgi:hypothetical protein
MIRPAGAFAIAGLIVTGGLTGASPAMCLLPGPYVAQTFRSAPASDGRAEALRYLSQPTTSSPALSREEVDRLIDRLGSFDVDVRTDAARAIRRAPGTVALPALMDAASGHADGFVRRRALVLVSGYDDPRVPDQMEQAAADSNDALRTIAYRYFERHPELRLVPMLLKALPVETAEFARPALIRALAAHGRDVKVQRALLAELSRGPDGGRCTTLEALGDHKAAYALKAIAPLAKTEGPCQVQASIALCLLGSGCEAQRTALVEDVSEPSPYAGVETSLGVAVLGLGTLAASGDAEAGRAVIDAAAAADRRVSPIALDALARLAVRRPESMVTLLAARDDRSRDIARLRQGFDRLADDFGEEQFFARLRTAYFAESAGSPTRDLIQTLINTLEF